MLLENGALDYRLELKEEATEVSCTLSGSKSDGLFSVLDANYWPAASAALGAFQSHDAMDLRTEAQQFESEEYYHRHQAKKVVMLFGLVLLLSAGLLYVAQFALLEYRASLEAELTETFPQSQELKSLELKLDQVEKRQKRLLLSTSENSSLALHLARLSERIPKELWLADILFEQSGPSGTQVVLNALAPNPTYLSLLLDALNQLKEINGAKLQQMSWKSGKEIYRKWAVRQQKSVLLTVEYNVRAIVEVD